MIKWLIVWTNWRTLVTFLYRVIVEIIDWRAHLRRLKGEPVADIIFVTNLRSNKDRKRIWGKWVPKEGFSNALRYWLNGTVFGSMQITNIDPKELTTKEGRDRERKYIIASVKKAYDKGTKLCLLAAGTKHLFDDPINGDGYLLKTMFPEMLFTNGDNGTALFLTQEVNRAFREAKPRLLPGEAVVAVLGSYGILGRVVTRDLVQQGFEVIGVGPNVEKLQEVATEFGIRVYERLDQVGEVDAVVACTHSESVCITSVNIGCLRKKDRKLLVIDVAEPSNVHYKEWLKMKDKIKRQDAGNAFNPGFRNVLNELSYRMMSVPNHVAFCCFAETMSLASALKRGVDLEGIDFFSVNEENMALVKRLFTIDGFVIPPPLNFRKPVKDFDLSYKEPMPVVEEKEVVASKKELVIPKRALIAAGEEKKFKVVIERDDSGALDDIVLQISITSSLRPRR